MRYLLDTHILIWFLTGNTTHLSTDGLAILQDTRSILCFSTVSIWELSIKSSLGKPDFQYSPRAIAKELLRLQFSQLDIALDHVLAVGSLPLIHRDPFDRLLLVQSKLTNCQLLTADGLMMQYQYDYILNVRR